MTNDELMLLLINLDCEAQNAEQALAQSEIVSHPADPDLYRQAIEAIRDEQGRYTDLSNTFHEFANFIWGLFYPDDPTGWEYPGQVMREAERLIEAKNAYMKLLKLERDNYARKLEDEYGEKPESIL
jgi:3-methyladenine DNA glycosylase Tag